MKITLRILIIILTLILVAAAVGKSQTNPDDPNEPDTLYIDSVIAFTTGSGVVPVRFFNDEELTAIEVTLRHNTTAVTLDSFSFAGGRVSYITNRGFSPQSDSVTYTMYALVSNEAPIPAGIGLLGRVFYSWPQSITPQVVTIDTITTIDTLNIEKSTFFRPDAGIPFKPQSGPGYLDIQSAPLVMDSIWLDNIVAEPGEQIAVDIHLYNERNVNSVSVALHYGSDSLIFDSVSFEGTRGLTANKKQVQHSNAFNKLWTMITFGEDVPLEPGSGPLATIHFSVDADALEGLIFIDSTTFFASGNTFIDLTEADGSVQFTPFFTPGSVDVKFPTDVLEIVDDGKLPVDYGLRQNYPNPFNPTTTIEFALPRAGSVHLDVYNILGQNVKSLVNQRLPAGTHQMTFNGRSDSGSPLASGIYFYRLVTDDYTESRKMMLIK
jgi:hypothetical protein